jgi:hypothetical protein
MAEQLTETQLAETVAGSTLHDAVDASDPAIARKNVLWGWGLFGLFLLLFGGTAGVALVYLWLD